jgi:Ca-activated chloride channel family protein
LSNPRRRKKYDAGLPPEEDPSLPVKHRIFYSRPSLIRSDESQLLYILLEISAREKTKEIPAPPLNISLVLDRSTSMNGEKLDVLKNASIKVMRSMRPQDIFSVITFSDRAEVLIPASNIYEKNRLEARIQMLQPSGGTEIFQGLQTAFDELRRNSNNEHIDHIILLTDGHTYGDEEQCLELAKKAAERGIGMSAMGIGKEWNDQLLDTLAKSTGGNSQYISKPKDIEMFLVKKFDTLARTLAEDVILDFEPVPGVEVAYAFRTQPETGPLPTENPIHLGPVLQDTTLNVLFEFMIDPSTTTEDYLQLFQGLLKLTIAAMPTPVQPLRIEFSRDIKEEPELTPPPAAIIQALGQLTLYRMQEKAHQEVQQGQFELAAKHMKQLATNLLEQGERSLARTALIEADNIKQLQAISEEGSKRIKYGTRALIESEMKDIFE